ncbi:MAG TPA: DUF4922 domain-containing protein [Terriglobia bacterium]|nr:DUF4922 domain-containing protein [Terriglobia bacterium]
MKSGRANNAEQAASGLSRWVRELIAEQSRSWPLLQRGLEGLRAAESRTVSIGAFEVSLRHIPHRIVSTTAAVDKASIEKRPCFLCAANLPPEEHGLPLNAEFTAYCNPFPIVDGHLTVVHNDHRPQAIDGRVRTLIDLAVALPDWLFIYNGPACGASAPDHLHFQALARHEGDATIFPIETDVRRAEGVTIPGYRRRVVVIQEPDLSRLAVRVERLIAVLGDVTGRKPEPLINMAAFADDAGGCTVCLFPRSKHRPRVYETKELTVSPASVDLSGIVVVPVKADYDKVTGEAIGQIFDEVTLDNDGFNAALRQWDEKA